MSSDEQQILDLLKQRETGIAASDAAAATASTQEGAVRYDLAPPLAGTFSKDEAIQYLNIWFDTWDGGVTSELKHPNILVSDDLAVVYGLSNIRGDKKGEGPTDLWFRSTVVLRKTKGAWAIVHEHESVPMAMDGSNCALTDLKPEMEGA